MNALTKTFVVVVTILAVILVALVIPFVAQVDDDRQAYRDAQLAFNTQLAVANKEAADARAEMAKQGEKDQENADNIRQLQEELAMVKSDRTELQAKLAQTENTMARMTAAIEVANRVNENKDGQIGDLSKLVQEQIASLGQQQSQIADLTQTLINVRQDNRRLSNNFRRIQEENKALAQEVEEASAMIEQQREVIAANGIDIEKYTPPVPQPGEVIRGSVTSIDQIGDGLTFVQLNVGSRDRVKEGMEFTVSRGDAFIGKIEIASVDQGESVGKLTLGGGIQEGDAVKAGN